MAYNISPAVADKYKKFLADAKKSAGYMSTEFQRRRAAYQFSRARESTSGTLDMRKLASYKTRDDIFRATMQLADAQSHGMFMLIDQSGSMESVRGAVAERVIELCEFCRLSSIPFTVYAFTAGIGVGGYVQSEVTDSILMTGMVMVELVSSTMKQIDYEEAIRDYWYASSEQSLYNVMSKYDRLGSTPLLEALILTHSLAKDFKQRTAVQKMNIVVISDGDGGCMSVTTPDRNYVATYRKKIEIELNGNQILFADGDYKGTYTALIKNLKATLGAMVMCFYLFNGRHVPDFMTLAGADFKSADIQILNDKLYGYNAFIGMRASALETDTFGEDPEAILKRKSEVRAKNGKDATIKIGDIRHAFVKASVNRTERNQFAQKFIQMIA